MTYHDFVNFFFIVVISFVPKISAYCWEPGQNPSFSGAPIVTQIDLSTLKVSWNNLVSRVDCADNFIVKYWKDTDPINYEMTDYLPTDVFSTTIKVIPRVLYTIEVIAREDKGLIMGVDYNRSPKTKFQTSRYNDNVTPDINVLPPPKEKKRDEKQPMVNPAVSNNIRDQNPDPDTFLSTEMIALICACIVVGSMIVIGFVYKVTVMIMTKNREVDDNEMEIKNKEDCSTVLEVKNEENDSLLEVAKEENDTVIEVAKEENDTVMEVAKKENDTVMEVNNKENATVLEVENGENDSLLEVANEENDSLLEVANEENDTVMEVNNKENGSVLENNIKNVSRQFSLD